jgi:predicted nucleic acid-binding protein
MRVGSLTTVAAAKAIGRFEREFSNRYLLVETTPQIVQRAMTLAKKHILRGYDAVQLASAIQANQDRISIGGAPLVFISADNHLNVAAAAEGLTVDNPNNHP